MEFLIGFIFVVLLVTVVGHGLWVLFRAIFRFLGAISEGPGARAIPAEICPSCGMAWPASPRRDSCPTCNWSRGGIAFREDLRPEVAARVLEQLRARVLRYMDHGLIPRDVGRSILDAIPSRQAARAPERPITYLPSEPTPAAKPRLPDVAGEDDLYILDDEPARNPAPATVPTREAPPLFATPKPPEPIPTPRQPRRSWVELLGAFQEESNIRWGELIGGLLIVGCSLALVISFWSSIAERPFLKFGLFNGVTALIYLLGLYSSKKWQLPNTSRGLLVIAGLLTPLNFLAVAALGKGDASSAANLWTIGGEVVAIGLFAWLIDQAGKILVGSSPRSLVLSVLVPSASMLVIGRLLGFAENWLGLAAIGSLPLLAQTGGQWIWRWSNRGQTELGTPKSVELLQLLGLGGFASALSLGLIVWQGERAGFALRDLSCLSPFAGLALLSPGVLLWMRGTRETAAFRVTGASIAAAGVICLLAGTAFAWPAPGPLLAVCVLDVLILSVLGVTMSLPIAHGFAGVFLSLAYLLIWGLGSGRIGWQADSSTLSLSLLANMSAGALIPLALAYASGAYGLLRKGKTDLARPLGMVAGVCSLYSAGVVTWNVLNVPDVAHGSAWIYLALALSYLLAGVAFGRTPLITANGRGETNALVWTGSAFGVMASLLGLGGGEWKPWFAIPGIVSLIVDAMASLGLAAILRLLWRRTPQAAFEHAARILERWAQGVAVFTTIILVATLRNGPAGSLSWYSLLIGGVFLVAAYRFRSDLTFGAFQILLSLSFALGVQSILQAQEWYNASEFPLLDPRSLQAIGVGLTILCGAWVAIRLASRRLGTESDVATTWRALLDPGTPTFDQLLRGGLVILLVGLVLYGVLPGMAQELTPRDMAGRLAGVVPAGRVVPPISAFELTGIPHGPASGVGSWMFWLATLALLAGSAFERLRARNVVTSIVVLSLLAPLLAARWESDVAVASAMRWAGSLTVLGISALIWSRRSLARVAGRYGLDVGPDGSPGGTGLATAVAVLIALLPWMFMGGYTGVTSVVGHALPPSVASVGPGVLAVCLNALLFAGAAWIGAGYFGLEEEKGRRWKSFSILVAILASLPLVVLTSFTVMSALVGNPVVGPDPSSLFRRMGNAGSYVPPLLIFAVTLIGYAIRERSAGFAFSASLMMNLAATSGFLMLTAQRGQGLSAEVSIRLGQINVVMLSLGGLCWLGAVLWHRRRHGGAGEPFAEPLLDLLRSLAIALAAAVIGTATLGLLYQPNAPAWVIRAGDPLGFVALLFVGGLHVVSRRMAGGELGMANAGGWCAGLASYLGLSAVWIGRGPSESVHILMDCHAIASILPAFLLWQSQRQHVSWIDPASRIRSGRWSLVSLFVIAAFAVRLYENDPRSPLWTVSGLVFCGLLAAGLVAWMGRTACFVLSALCFNLAASLWWGSTNAWLSSTGMLSAFGDMVRANIAALAIPCALWFWVERRFLRDADGFDSTHWSLPFHEHASRLALIGLMLTLAIGLSRDATRDHSTPTEWLGWLAFASTAAAIAVGLWDPRSRRADFRLYLLGLATCGWLVHIFHLPPRWLAWTGTVVLSAYGVATSYLWSMRDRVRSLAFRIGIETLENQGERPGWLIPSNGFLALAVGVIGFGFILNDQEILLRQLAAQAVLAQTLSIGLLAVGDRRGPLQKVTLTVGLIGLVGIGWALIEPEAPTAFLDRGAVVVLASIAVGGLYGIGLAKLLREENDWTRAGEAVMPWIFGLQVTSIVGLVFLEGLMAMNGREVTIAMPAAIAVVVAIVCWVVSSLTSALVPGRDIFRLSERGRTAYVYAAEAMLGLMGAHLKFTMPWLFGGFFVKYWVLIVMGLAFLGVGLSELFRRQGRMVLSDPLEKTGAFLPALPMIASIWLTPRPGEDVAFLVLVGMLYAVVSFMRTSLLMGALATLAFNGALWTLWSHAPGLAFAQHPQLWVIPPALCLLAGGYLNRERLTESQLATVRYLSALAIYVSSTTEIVLTGVGQAPWLPLVLAALSIGGIFAGILLRIRGFLFLGTGFLGLAIFSVIWHAAVDLNQTWLWWASGIVTGVLILAMFALFEKKRQEILKVVEELKDWSV